VIPVYNEEGAVGPFLAAINQVFPDREKVDLEMIFVNDGSRDDTLTQLLDLQKHDPRIRLIDLSRNFGKEAALSAGLIMATGQVMIPLDVDLQDPPEVIPLMLDKWREGYEVVLGHRVDRQADTRAKRILARWFYRLHNKIADHEIPENVGDFRLMDRRVVEALKSFPETHRFMKGLFAWLGFRTCQVNYVRPRRISGKSSFSGWKLWNFALEGVTSFSTAPLRIWTYIGLAFSLVSFIFALFIAARVFITGVDVPGYASLMVAITFLGGLQLVGIGIIGEYLGRTYIESKRRPVFVIRHLYEPGDNESARPGSGKAEG
jgi:glycosyltransferase involved in cell wall biosynthesis